MIYMDSTIPELLGEIQHPKFGFPSEQQIKDAFGNTIDKRQYGAGEIETIQEMKKRGYLLITHRKGYPDLMFKKTGTNKLAFVEVKSGNDELEEPQKKVLSELRKAGSETYLSKYDKKKGQIHISLYP
jgi:hypothetical protein